MTERSKILFILNPASGVREKNRIIKIIDNQLDAKKYDSSIAVITRPGHAYELAAEAVKNEYAIVVAVGGDGSVNLVAKALQGTHVKLGIIPSGSGNGLARFLKIPLNPEKALALINRGKTKRIDSASLNDEFFISIAGVGFDARVADEFSRQKRRGFLSYFKVSLREFFRHKPQYYRMIIGADTFDFEAFFISLANSNQFGYNTSIAPEASIDDGLLDICIVDKPPLISVPFIAYMLFTGRFNRIKYVRIIKASRLRLIQRDSDIVNLDGDPVRTSPEMDVKVNPLSVEVVIS
ncbi:MAG: diacylglycerol kinase family protein [Bacteroidales bacterium]